MEANWALLDENNIVVFLFFGDINVTDTTPYGDIKGMVKYSYPFEDRGTPIVGSVWNGEINKFI
jgi:hypothetical protein